MDGGIMTNPDHKRHFAWQFFFSFQSGTDETIREKKLPRIWLDCDILARMIGFHLSTVVRFVNCFGSFSDRHIEPRFRLDRLSCILQQFG